MHASRIEFERNLDELIADKVTLDDPLNSVGKTNFYLAYHGLNDRELQVKVAKYYEQACPSLLYAAQHCYKPKSDIQKNIRVGFLSKFLYNHSVSLCFSKIIETLSLKEQFEFALISNSQIDEKIYSKFVGKRVCLPYNLEQAREMLAALELDVLVYLDIGMEPLSYFLAFSRLARVQCVLGGHPVTTGIGNMDFFLSNAPMELAGADEHYSEKLVRLPMGVFYFERPVLPARFKTRDELGLPEGRHLYMCPMKLQKIHPDFDEAISRILQIDGNAVVILFEDHAYPYWKKELLKRFEKTIPRDVRERILFLPWINEYTDFISANAAADVVLDPFHFGIGSTIAATFAVGTPIVTKPGGFMRGRVGMGLCKMMDLPECIAEDTESYARLAVEIATDQSLREGIKAKILANNHVLYENPQPADDLADFFCSLTD
jgi:predicted O-linked N-acetylglucosamine transferase (SPINDLY family)